ncbi:aldo/keto reductase [Streptomyces tricolor]|nr:aldo/keto reductase [Streptomyces tricolor]
MSSKVPRSSSTTASRCPSWASASRQVPDDEAERAVATALEAGHRSIDTAAIYGNEEGTGKAIAASACPARTSSSPPSLEQRPGHDSTLARSTRRWRSWDFDYVDPYPIHWPLPSPTRTSTPTRRSRSASADGRVRAIGSLQLPARAPARRLLAETRSSPRSLDRELHLGHLQQREGASAHAERGHRHLEAWSPLGQGKARREWRSLGDRAKHERTPAQGGAGAGAPARQRRDPEVR